MIELRWYQNKLLDEAREAMKRTKKVCIQAPTGSGKTIMFGSLAKRVSDRGKRVLITCHRRELRRQAVEKLEMFGVYPGIIRSGSHSVATEPVVVADIGTLVNRLDVYAGAFDLVIPDECHHSVSPTWKKVFAAFHRSYLLGFTATPERLDGQGLADVFDELIVGPPVRQLIDEGHLCDYIAYGPPNGLPDLAKLKMRAGDYANDELAEVMSTSVIIGDIISHYRKCADGLPAVAFAVNVHHAELLARAFQVAGYRAYSVDGTMDHKTRAQRIDGLANGYTQILTSCNLVSEGLDIPGIHCAILARPTESLSLFLQQVGRALRPKPGGEKAIILDHAGNIALRHGLPDAAREWTLKAAGKSARDSNPVKTCPECFAIVEASRGTCPSCGHKWASTPAEEPALPRVVEGDLVEYGPGSFGPDGKPKRDRASIDAAVRQCESWDALEALRKVLGYKPGWSRHVAEALGWEPVRYNGAVIRYRARGVTPPGPGSGGFQTVYAIN